MAKIYQQGDVILVPVAMIPMETKNLGTVVVQEGEHTGHAHRFLNGGVEVFGGTGDSKYLRVTSETGSTLTHEEHLPQVIEKGDYEVRIVRQVDIFSKVVSKVVD